MERVPIPFNKPSLAGMEQEYIAEAVLRGHLSGDGWFTARCQAVLEEEMGAPKALLTTSCTHALEMTALLLDLQAGDEIILPSFTFVSTANAFALRGAKPVFADIRADTLNIDESLIPGLVTDRTRAIVVVHYAGVACEMNSIGRTARERGIPVIEDNAHGLFGKYHGKPLGSFGALATQSFHETKNLQCGEGGALIINDASFIDRAEIIREKGTDRARFFRGQIDKYTWVATGSSYLPSELLAAFLLAQLQERSTIQQRRREIWETYERELGPWAQTNGMRMPIVPPHCEQPYHMFYLLAPSLNVRHSFIEKLRNAGVHAVFHYLPLNTAPRAAELGVDAHCPVAEETSDRLVRLPLYNSMTQHELERVLEAVHACNL